MLHSNGLRHSSLCCPSSVFLSTLAREKTRNVCQLARVFVDARARRVTHISPEAQESSQRGDLEDDDIEHARRTNVMLQSTVRVAAGEVHNVKREFEHIRSLARSMRDEMVPQVGELMRGVTAQVWRLSARVLFCF